MVSYSYINWQEQTHSRKQMDNTRRGTCWPGINSPASQKARQIGAGEPGQEGEGASNKDYYCLGAAEAASTL